ncbi:hypothetical protein [Leifsonia virtsii]|uniref:DUF559 domain-containing protein n=1 Tax=Leifsonia virtsii TaxID=3035915 RepID=A0ABT8ISW1_9MICO|nr:hypothetical protein [Leifsonia virtsii]MDN4595813.1 hypothetical protein [Leifsonia virtsii]
MSEPAESIRELCVAYLAVMPSAAFFSHSTAAALLGIPLPSTVSTFPLHVTVRAPRSAPQGRGIIGHSLGSVAGQIVDGLPVCTPAHVWCQLAAEVGGADLVAAADHLVGARARPALATVDELAQLSAQLTRVRGGRARAWALPRIRFGAESRPETLLRLFLEELGFVDLEVNLPVMVDAGRVTLHPDLSLPAARIAFEYEGDRHRMDRRQWSQDIRRRELLEFAGWRVVRVTAADLFHDRRTFVDRLRRFVPNLGSEAANPEIWRKS